MLLKFTWLTLLLTKIYIVNCFSSSSSSCSFICLNQTKVDSNLSPPAICINDTDIDTSVLFLINCTSNDTLYYTNISVLIDNHRSIDIKDSLPLTLFSFNVSTQNVTFNLTIHSRLLGYSRLSLHAEYLNGTKNKLNYTNDLYVDFVVKRKTTALDTIFTVVVIILVCIGTFLIGCRLVMQNLYSNLRKPGPILIGLFSQFMCLPLVRRKKKEAENLFFDQSA